MMEHTPKLYIGVDVSKHQLDVFLPTLKQNQSVGNNAAGYQTICTLAKEHETSMVVMEATGGYEKKLSQALLSEKIPVAVVNPKRVRDYARAVGIGAKTDKIDAMVIAGFATTIRPRAMESCSMVIQELKEKNARRSQLVGIRALEKQHLETASTWQAKVINESIARLSIDIDKLEEVIKDLLKSDVELSRKYELLTSAKGVGLCVAVRLLCDLPELGKVKGKEIAALVGVAPYNRDSGSKQGQRSTWGGRSEVRTALYLAVLSGKKHNPRIKEFYDRLIGNGKEKQVAMIASIRKLAVILNAMLRDEMPWQPK